MWSTTNFREPRVLSHGLLLAIAGLTTVVTPVQGETVFDNSQGSLTNYFALTTEFGDEIYLEGSARTVTRFDLEFFGDFSEQSNVEAVIRFYENDVPHEIAPRPGTLLYDSGSFAIGPGTSTISLVGLSVEVPDHFTWTVDFEGVGTLPGDRAAVFLNWEPTVGFSYDDYWRRDEEGLFKTYIFKGAPVANFAARVEAAPDPGVVIEDLLPASNGGIKLVISGPIGATFRVQASADLEHWSDVSTFTFQHTLQEVVERVGGTPHRFYRIVAPEGQITQLILLPDEGVQLTLSAPVGSRQLLQFSGDLITWTTLETLTFSEPTREFIEAGVASLDQRYYRLIPAPSN